MNLSMGKRESIVEQSIGKKFGKLTVEKFIEFRKTPRGKNVPIVECHCECGKTKNVSLWDLRSKKTKTCGFDHPHYEDRSLPAFNNLYNNAYRGRARKLGLEFALTKEQFRELTQKSCHYCGCKPNGSGRRITGNQISHYTYNGLDRIDSSKGYTTNNIVPCCGICNHAKHTMSYEDFINWINRLTKFRKNL